MDSRMPETVGREIEDFMTDQQWILAIGKSQQQ
jgi:hypothetical protein